jgi:hypothetical protein
MDRGSSAVAAFAARRDRISVVPTGHGSARAVRGYAREAPVAVEQQRDSQHDEYDG